MASTDRPDALGAADAIGLDDDRGLRRLVVATRAVERACRDAEQPGERVRLRRHRAGVVDAGLAARHGLGIGQPSWPHCPRCVCGSRRSGFDRVSAGGHAMRLPRYQRSWASASMDLSSRLSP